MSPAPVQIVEREFIARGAVADLFDCEDEEILLEGPAGTGKTRGALTRIHALCETHPGIRVLIVRQTRVSMTESVLKTFEEEVLTPDHPLIRGDHAGRANRQSYEYPNKSRIVIGGMDKPSKIMSTDYDQIFFAEATEGTLEGHENLVSRLRNGRLHFQQIICDCNPGPEAHWLNQRANQKHEEGPLKGRRKMRRLISRHVDNPRWYNEDGQLTDDGRVYMGKLFSLTGYRRERLLHGRWVSAEGQVWPEFDPAIHVLDGQLVRNKDDKWIIRREYEIDIVLVEFAAGVDWGYRNPGVLLVGGMDYDGNLYIVHQVYRRGQDIEWWSDTAVQVYRKFGIYPFCCGHERPDNIDIFNRRLGRHPKGEAIARKGETDRGSGIDVVRQWLRNKRVFILYDSLEERDSLQVEELRPCGLIEEIPSYVFRDRKEGQEIKEEVASDVDDHACDAFRYLLKWYDKVGAPEPEGGERTYARGTFADYFNHEEITENDPEWQTTIRGVAA